MLVKQVLDRTRRRLGVVGFARSLGFGHHNIFTSANASAMDRLHDSLSDGVYAVPTAAAGAPPAAAGRRRPTRPHERIHREPVRLHDSLSEGLYTYPWRVRGDVREQGAAVEEEGKNGRQFEWPSKAAGLVLERRYENPSIRSSTVLHKHALEPMSIPEMGHWRK